MNIKELLSYRELFASLASKELRVRYKQSVLGVFWALLNPLVLMIVYTFIFSVVFPARGVRHYPLFLLAGLLPWNFFSLSINSAVASIVNNENLVKKVYFPREVLPLSIIAANFFNFVIEISILIFFLLLYKYFIFPFLPLLLLTIVLQVMVVVGISLFLAAMNVFFRDVQQITNMLMLVWFFATPVVYKLEMLDFPFNQILKLNPMTPVILLYRSALIDLNWPNFHLILAATIYSLVILFFGYYFFKKKEPDFAKEV